MVPLLANLPCEAELRTWTAGNSADFGAGNLDGVQVHPDSLVLLGRLPADRNLAFGRPVEDDLGNEVPLSDGSIELAKGEWVSGTPRVIGRQFMVDLGMDRAISRVRILAGATALSQPESFMRGYRLEAATQINNDFWRLLAEEKANFKRNVDTAVDSTWKVLDSEGDFLPRMGRFVRLELISQDRSNWVSLGEIEVFGVGFVEEGNIEGEFSAAEPVNVGRMRWEAEIGEQTQVEMRFRGTNGEQTWPEWGEEAADSDVLFRGEEPAIYLQYQGLLKTQEPFSTPALRRVEVEYDPVLVAQGVSGSVVPDTVRKGEIFPLKYTAEIEVGMGDYGVDFIRLDGVELAIEEVSLDGGILSYDETLGRGYRWEGIPSEESTLIEFAPSEQIAQSAVVQIVGRGLFLQDWTPIQLQMGSREQAERDGYVNWQNGPLVQVRGLGSPPDLLSEIEIEPRPFLPFGAEHLDIRFVVGNVRETTDVVVEIFSLDGRRVRKMAQEGRARAYNFAWDGRNRDGKVVAPGLYLYEIRVETGDSNGRTRGAFVVAH
jgi:hypothetical protein